MKRIILIFVIVALCLVVAIGGNMALVNSHSVLKKQQTKHSDKVECRILVDVTENRLFLFKDDKMVKSYPVSPSSLNIPSPIGNWKIVQKVKLKNSAGGYWIGLNVPWGKYGIQGTNDNGNKGDSISHGCIRMFNDDVAELYRIVSEQTEVDIYGGPYGAFGSGYRKLTAGDRGSDVFAIEEKLKDKGYLEGKINGVYDHNMLGAVHKFQRKNGLKVSDDIDSAFYKKLGIVLIE